jgi:hypothetical protein
MKDGRSMRINHLSFLLLALFAIGPALAQQPSSDVVPGYRHSAASSRFFASESFARIKPVEEHGFVKYQGREGVLAIDEKTGLALAVPSASQDKASRTPVKADDAVSMLDPDKQNEMVLDYFVKAGLPRSQVADVHANTYLSASGPTSGAMSVQPRVDGYASIVTRKAGNFIVVDSVAWARLTDRGQVIGEWVYWPPLPARVIDDARRLNELLNGPRRGEFLAKLPSAQRTGRVVVRHSSPFAGGAFEAFASYDVLERRESPERGTTSTYVRHFDVDGREIRLPQERRSLGADYPPKERTETTTK